MLLGIANARIGPLVPWTSERWWLARALVGIAGLRCRLRRSGGRWLAWLLFLRLRDLRLFRLQRYFTLGSNLLGAAYLHGDDDGLQEAWEGYVQACVKYPRERHAVQWWMAKQYAQRGFFADAAEVLSEMLGRGPENTDARYVLAEMRWWRDHADCIAWLV